MSKKVIVGIIGIDEELKNKYPRNYFDKYPNTYMIRVLKDGQNENDEITVATRGQMLEIDNISGVVKISEVQGLMGMAKFSPYWKKYTVPDIQLQEWLSKAISFDGR